MSNLEIIEEIDTTIPAEFDRSRDVAIEVLDEPKQDEAVQVESDFQ